MSSVDSYFSYVMLFTQKKTIMAPSADADPQAVVPPQKPNYDMALKASLASVDPTTDA